MTGAEALYADLGHFRRGPIQFAWIAVVFPALAVNYLGQGATVLAKPEAGESPFFLLYPGWAQLPMVLLATAATVIASQAQAGQICVSDVRRIWKRGNRPSWMACWVNEYAPVITGEIRRNVE